MNNDVAQRNENSGNDVYSYYWDNINYDSRQLLNRGGVARDFRHIVFDEIASYLKALGLTIRTRHRKEFELHLPGPVRKPVTLGNCVAVLQSDLSGRYWVFDLHDWPDIDENIESCILDLRCQLVLKSQFRCNAVTGDRSSIVKPWTYFDFNWPLPSNRLSVLRRHRRLYNQLYFRGDAWCGRGAVLEILQGRGILSPDVSRVPYDQYLQESASHVIMLSLPGLGDFCHRDVEGFAVGTCVLRPKVHTEFHDELKANHHYISVDTDIERDAPELVAECIEARLLEVRSRPDYLRTTAGNAVDWYDRNVSLFGSMRLTAELLALAGLNCPTAPS